MEDSEGLVFVEVRARSNYRDLERAAESIDFHKQQRLVKAALRYLQQHRPEEDLPCRMDVVLLLGPIDGTPCLHWIRSAYDSPTAP